MQCRSSKNNLILIDFLRTFCLPPFFLLPKMGIFYKSHIMITYLTFSYFILVLGFNIFIFLTAGNEGDSIARIKFVHHMIHLYIFFSKLSRKKVHWMYFFMREKIHKSTLTSCNQKKNTFLLCMCILPTKEYMSHKILL